MEMHQERMLRRIALGATAGRRIPVLLFRHDGQFPPHFFEDFVGAHPQTRFHFFSYPDDAHGRQFANTDADLFFSTAAMPGLDMTLAHQFHVPLCVLASVSHPLANRGSVRLADLRGQDILCINSDLESQNRLHKSFGLQGIRVSSILSDAEQQFSYFLVRRCGSQRCGAGDAAAGGHRCLPAHRELSPALVLLHVPRAFRGNSPHRPKAEGGHHRLSERPPAAGGRADYPHRRPLSPSGQGRGCAQRGRSERAVCSARAAGAPANGNRQGFLKPAFWERAPMTRNRPKGIYRESALRPAYGRRGQTKKEPGDTPSPFGADDQIRTGDLILTKDALYPTELHQRAYVNGTRYNTMRAEKQGGKVNCMFVLAVVFEISPEAPPGAAPAGRCARRWRRRRRRAGPPGFAGIGPETP